jgi:hypothetical protein
MKGCSSLGPTGVTDLAHWTQTDPLYGTLFFKLVKVASKD